MLPLALTLTASAAPQTHAFAESTTLALTLPAGAVTVTPGETLSVTLSPTDWHERCRVSLEEDRSATLVVEQPRKATACAADAVVTVPEGDRLRLALASGDVMIDGTDGLIDVLVGTGDVTLSAARGSVFVAIEEGQLTGTAEGGLLADLEAGSVSVRWAGLPTGDIHVQTREGDVSLSLPADVSLSSTDRQPASFRAVMPDERTVQADTRRGAVSVTEG